MSGSEARFSPQMFVNYFTALRGITVEDLGVGPIAVVAWHQGVVRALAEEAGAQPSQHWIYGERNPMFTGSVDGVRVSFAHLPVGAPGTVMVMEEMIACGAQVFLGLGWAGSLQSQAPIGTLIISTGCVREEGTSFHYLGQEAVLTPSKRLVQIVGNVAEEEGAKPTAGVVWSIDAPYRETVSKIETYRAQGVLGVDMETSAMYALGQVRGAEVCNVLVVSDELWREWKPAFGTAELQGATQRAQRVILQSIRRLASRLPFSHAGP